MLASGNYVKWNLYSLLIPVVNMMSKKTDYYHQNYILFYILINLEK